MSGLRRVGQTLTVVLLLLSGVSAQDGWTIPDTAKEQKSPLEPTDDVLKKGKSVYGSNCQRCHGPEGLGNGPYANPKHPPANLTDEERAASNPDGVLYYKIFN